ANRAQELARTFGFVSIARHLPQPSHQLESDDDAPSEVEPQGSDGPADPGEAPATEESTEDAAPVVGRPLNIKIFLGLPYWNWPGKTQKSWALHRLCPREVP
ncbi:MAG: hypothetical protein AAGA86_03095, partial [Bacteroidota bacterium]